MPRHVCTATETHNRVSELVDSAVRAADVEPRRIVQHDRVPAMHNQPNIVSRKPNLHHTPRSRHAPFRARELRRDVDLGCCCYVLEGFGIEQGDVAACKADSKPRAIARETAAGRTEERSSAVLDADAGEEQRPAERREEPQGAVEAGSDEDRESWVHRKRDV